MARNTQEIRAELDSAYKEQFELTDEQMTTILAKESKAGGWATWRGIFAMAAFTLELLFDRFVTLVTEMAKGVEYGNKKWWSSQILRFQYGDLLVETNGKFAYAAIDAEKQIISRCAFPEYDGLVLVKIAHLNGSNLEKISDAGQLAAIQSYIKTIKPAGIRHQLISANADKLAFSINIVYEGKLVEADLKTNVETTIKSFLNDLSLSDFDGLFRPNKLRDALEAIDGVLDVFIVSAQKQVAGSTTWQDVSLTANHSAVSGYFSFDLNTSVITYQPE
ncbi:MAG: baseplate J/gp47 family protein [Candidatus Methylacidiphilales bacterium]